jgi:hypothetical protein
VDVFPNDPLEDRPLTMIGLDGEYERHVGYVRNMKRKSTPPAAAKMTRGAFSML